MSTRPSLIWLDWSPEEGMISYSKVTAIFTLAVSEWEELLLHIGKHIPKLCSPEHAEVGLRQSCPQCTPSPCRGHG